MTNLLDNSNSNVPITSFSEFINSDFAELNSPTNDWYVDLREYGFYYESTYLRDHVFFYEPTYWKNTLIPLAIRLYHIIPPMPPAGIAGAGCSSE